MTQSRIPRPLGTTYLSQSHAQAPPKQKNHIKNQLINLTLTHYLINNLQLNEQYMDTNDLARYLSISIPDLTKRLADRIRIQDKILGQDTLGSYTRASFFGILKNAWRAANLATRQAELLYSQQGEKYVPFLSTAANGAIANMYNSFGPLIALTKLGMPEQQRQPAVQLNQVNLNNAPTQVNNHLIGPDEANKLIEAQIAQYGIGTQQHIALLGTRDDLQNLPEIIATRHGESQILAQNEPKCDAESEAEKLLDGWTILE